MLAPTAAYQPDVYITREGKNNVLHCDVQSKGQGEEKKLNRMNLMRNKFTECRKRKEQQEAKKITIVKTPKTWKGMKMKSAKVTSNTDIQEEFVPIIFGADVIALYPSLPTWTRPSSASTPSWTLTSSSRTSTTGWQRSTLQYALLRRSKELRTESGETSYPGGQPRMELSQVSHQSLRTTRTGNSWTRSPRSTRRSGSLQQ